MYQDLCQRLMKSLRLEMVPVAVGFSTRPPENVKQLEGKLRVCEMFDAARYEGRIFYATAENSDDRHEMYWLGLIPAYDGLKSGDWNAGKWPDRGRANWASPAAVRRAFPYYYQVEEGTVKYLSFAPLDRSPFKPELGGVVVVLTCTPNQAVFLARAAIYKTGGMVRGIIGPSTCSEIMAGPLQTGEMIFSPGCLGGRMYFRVKTEDLFFGFPIEMLREVVENLEVQLRDRPDLDRILDLKVGSYHIATGEEKNAYRLQHFLDTRAAAAKKS